MPREEELRSQRYEAVGRGEVESDSCRALFRNRWHSRGEVGLLAEGQPWIRWMYECDGSKFRKQRASPHTNIVNVQSMSFREGFLN